MNEDKRGPSFFDLIPTKERPKAPDIPRPGRTPRLKGAKTIDKAVALARQLQAAVRLGLSPLLEQYPELIELAIAKAKDGDTKMLMFLIALPLKMVQLDEFRGENLGNDIIKDALAGRTVNIQVNNMAAVPRAVAGKARLIADEGTMARAEE